MSFLRNVRKGFMYFRRDYQLEPADMNLLEEYLSSAERDLFMEMDPPDRMHSVRVSRLCARSLENHPELDERIIMRAALLHDVGKIGANLGLVFRTFWVFGCKACSPFMRWIAKRSGAARPASVRGKMWLQITHADVGAQMLRELGAEEEVCRLIVATGEPRQDEPRLDVRIITEADADRIVERDAP